MTELAWQRKIGEILLQRSVVTKEQLEEALKIQEMILKPIGKILIDMEVTTETQIAEALAEQRGFARISLKEYRVSKPAVKLFPMAMARLHKALPIDFEGEKIVLAMADPLDVYAIDDVRMITGREVKPVVCTESEILTVIDEYLSGVAHPPEKDIAKVIEERLEEITASSEDRIPAFVDAVIALAAQEGASAIYFEPQEHASQLRLRLNGDLYSFTSLKKEEHAAVGAHLRKLFGMGKKEQDLADCRKVVKVGDIELDMEAILLPGVFGEDICVKIFHAGSGLRELEALGLSEQALTNIKTAFTARSGFILGINVVNNGQHSDGLSSLFHGILRTLVSSQKRIVVVGNSAQAKIKGVVQLQASTSSAASIGKSPALSAVLNSEPEVLLINDSMDDNNASLLTKAALHGALVLATLRDEDASSGLSRFAEMGVDSLLAAESLRCVVAGKTLKKLCDFCKKQYQPKPETLAMLSEKAGFKIELVEGSSFFTADGCKQCNNSGFSGTIGIFEAIAVSDEIKKALTEGKKAEEMRKIAAKEGMHSLWLDTYSKALHGDISFEEFVKQIG